MLLTYKAVDDAGKVSRASIEAPDTREAVDQLRRRGLYVTQIDETKSAPRRLAPTASPAASALPLKLVAQFTRQLAMLLKSGSGIVPAIQAVRRQVANPRHAAVFDQIVADLEDGMPLTDALRKHADTFDSVYCAIVAAGEASGAMAEMFDRLSGIVAKRRTMRKKILGAMAYPCMLVVMCFHIMLVLLLFVLPRFEQMFIQLGVETPITTQWLLKIGSLLRGYWYVGLAIACGAVTGVICLVRSSGGRQWLTDVQRVIPILGRLQSRLIQGQVFRTMGMLLESGVGVIDTLALVRSSTRSRRFQLLFDRLDHSVTSGGRLSTAFEESGVIDPYVCQAIHTGEDSGHLGGALLFVADNLDESNEELVNVITRLMEPLILILMGLVVGGVAISLFMPLFDMTSAMR